MRKILLLAVVLLCAHRAGAVSPIQFGVRAGVNVSKIDLGDARVDGRLGGNNYTFLLSSDPKTGYHVGLTSKVDLGLFRLLPEIVYSHNAYKLTAAAFEPAPKFPEPGPVESFPNPADPQSTVGLNSIQVPVLLETGLLFLKLQLGPVFNIWNEAAVKQKYEGFGEEVLYTRSSVGYMAGLGMNLGPLNLTARYNADFARPVQAITIGGGTTEVKTKLQTWMLGAEVRF